MSKYEKLWAYFLKRKEDKIILSFDEIEKISEIKIDHSFLNYKKELEQYGYRVNRISLKNKTVEFVILKL